MATTRFVFWTWIWPTRYWGRKCLVILNLTYETLGQEALCDIESNLWETGAGSALLISMLEKLNLFRLTSLITLNLFMWRWMGLFLNRNNLLKCWDFISLLNWIWALTLSLLLKLPPRKLEPCFFVWSLFFLRLLFISLNLPCGLAAST